MREPILIVLHTVVRLSVQAASSALHEAHYCRDNARYSVSIVYVLYGKTVFHFHSAFWLCYIGFMYKDAESVMCTQNLQYGRSIHILLRYSMRNWLTLKCLNKIDRVLLSKTFNDELCCTNHSEITIDQHLCYSQSRSVYLLSMYSMYILVVNVVTLCKFTDLQVLRQLINIDCSKCWASRRRRI